MKDAKMNSSHEPALPLRQSPSHTRPTPPKCWLIGSSPELPTAVGRVARLRGLDVEVCPADGAAIPSSSPARNQLIAINFAQLSRLEPDAKARLREAAENGATIYVRGALEPGRRFSLPPFSAQEFEFLNKPADGYQFSTHQILPDAIAGERVATHVN